MAIKHYEGKRVNKLKQCRRFRKDLVAAEKKHREAESEDAQVCVCVCVFVRMHV
jgi:hypothetical protein